MHANSPALGRLQSTVLLPGVYGLVLPGHGLLGHPSSDLRFPDFFARVCFHRHNEAYTWTNPTCCVHNIILGQLWIEQYGTVEILNHR